MTANRGETTNASASITLSARNLIAISTKRSTHFCTPFTGDGDLPIGLRNLCDNVDAKKIPNPPGSWRERCLEFTAVHSKKSILCVKTAHIDCAEANFHFEVAICTVPS